MHPADTKTAAHPPAVGTYAPPLPPPPAPDASDSPVTLKALAVVFALLIPIVTAAISYGVASARLDSKLDEVEYRKDQTALARELGNVSGDVRVIRTAVCRKDPEVCQ